MLAAIALAVHVLSAVVWVGGMFVIYLCVRPALDALQPPDRLQLMRTTFARFFPWVWSAVILLLATGYWILFDRLGGFADAGLYVHLMQGLGLVMMTLYLWLFHGPWLKFKRAVDAGDWPTAGGELNRIRRIIAVNLPLGLIVVAIAAGGRYWV